MPRRPQLFWDKNNRRWLKEYEGKKHSISCRQLKEKKLLPPDAQETKESSYQAANIWWVQKKATLDLQNGPKQRVPEPLEDVLAATGILDPDILKDPWKMGQYIFAEVMKRRKERGEGEVAAAADDDGENVTPEETAHDIYQMSRDEFVRRFVLSCEPLPEGLENVLPPARLRQVQSAVNVTCGGDSTPADRRLIFHRDRWMEIQKAKVGAGEMSVGQADNIRRYLDHFLAFIGQDASVDLVTPGLLQDFYVYLMEKIRKRRDDRREKDGWSDYYCQGLFNATRKFIRHMGEQGVIETPQNLDSRTFRFGVKPKAVEVWSAEEFKKVLGAATGQLRLHILLMANCGMQFVDIANLRDKEVDWKEGRIRRKRRKTEGHPKVPVVDYPLWPTTFDLLKQYRSGGDPVLLTESGGLWVRDELKEGTRSKTNNITSVYDWQKKAHFGGFSKPLIWLRKTSASLLASSQEFNPYAQLFLGHAPTTMAEKHYIRPSQERFNEAVLWLGKQLGQVETVEG